MFELSKFCRYVDKIELVNRKRIDYAYKGVAPAMVKGVEKIIIYYHLTCNVSFKRPSFLKMQYCYCRVVRELHLYKMKSSKLI